MTEDDVAPPTAYPHGAVLRTTDIAVVNAMSHPSWRDQTYLLRPGPIRFETERVAIDADIRLCRWSYRGAARTFAHLDAGSLYVAFPRGEALRVDGRPIDGEVMAVSLGGADYSGSTLQEVRCEELLITGETFSALMATLEADGLRSRMEARCGGRMVVTVAQGAALTLRDRMRETLDAALQGLKAPAIHDPATSEHGGDGATGRGRTFYADFDAAAHRSAVLELLRGALEASSGAGNLLAEGAGLRRHALAREAERLIWRRVASGEGGLSLDDLCAALGTTRRTLQLAFQEHFDTPFGLVTRSARLQRVRAELGSGAASAVSDAALRCGFEHLGRFARYYRDFFGESPSVTLRNQRQRRPAA